MLWQINYGKTFPLDLLEEVSQDGRNFTIGEKYILFNPNTNQKTKAYLWVIIQIITLFCL
jgi:hypothetical protein